MTIRNGTIKLLKRNGLRKTIGMFGHTIFFVIEY